MRQWDNRTNHQASRAIANPNLTSWQLVAAVGVLTIFPVLMADDLLKTDSRSPYVHRITLYDENGEAIDPTDKPAVPYSPSQTCGKCHPYGKINHGWHFNAADIDVDHGRPGEPWILIDEASGTQIPLTFRSWPNSFRPSEAGMSPWQFLTTFARHQPGSGVGDKRTKDDVDLHTRWMISGNLEINCLLCHSADQSHDPAEWVRQIMEQNFKWAPTGATNFAIIRGSAKRLSDDWDPFAGPNPDRPDLTGPVVVYNQAKFDANDRVFFNVTRTPPSQRCYFCHTTRVIGNASRERWEADTDVHLDSGMTCVDCHRNSIDHEIVRGYEDEPLSKKKPSAGTLTCRGCHLGTENGKSGAVSLGGRLGAPHPMHQGMPTVHFKKLSCTACHSGPWPESTTVRFQTSMAHALGTTSRRRNTQTPPHITGPVFVKNEDGMIEPHKMVWPSFWGREAGSKVVPMALDELKEAGIVSKSGPKKKANAEPAEALNEEKIAEFLGSLSQKAKGTPVFVSGARIHRRGADGKLTSEEHPAARPYSWPIAHDVRPAAQSFGVRGCTDCHAADAPFYFGKVFALSPVEIGETVEKKMFEFRGEDRKLAEAWALSFRARPAFKWFSFICAGLVGAVLLLYGFKALNSLTEWLKG